MTTVVMSCRAAEHRLDEPRQVIPQHGCVPAVKYQTKESGQSGKEQVSRAAGPVDILEKPGESAAKAAGSLVLNKPIPQCGSRPRAQYSDDVSRFE